jgi:hypothetical protein
MSLVPKDPFLWFILAEIPLMMMTMSMLVGIKRKVARAEAAELSEPAAAPPPPHTAAEELAAFKLEVARTYVPLSLIRDLDARLTQHMLRIEQKLDEVARTAAAAQAVVQQPGRRP